MKQPVFPLPLIDTNWHLSKELNKSVVQKPFLNTRFFISNSILGFNVRVAW